MIGLSLYMNSYAQQSDSIQPQKRTIDLILGTKLFLTKASPEIRFATNIGLDAYLFKNKKFSISYRNFFSTWISPRDTFLNKSIRLIDASDAVNLCYEFSKKNYYLKLGLGPYFGREEAFVDQYTGRPNKEYGIDFMMYTKLHWLNIGYRHQIRLHQLGGLKGIDLGVDQINRFSICVEVPIHIK
jgi:hypothetical protein